MPPFVLQPVLDFQPSLLKNVCPGKRPYILRLAFLLYPVAAGSTLPQGECFPWEPRAAVWCCGTFCRAICQRRPVVYGGGSLARVPGQLCVWSGLIEAPSETGHFSHFCCVISANHYAWWWTIGAGERLFAAALGGPNQCSGEHLLAELKSWVQVSAVRAGTALDTVFGAKMFSCPQSYKLSAQFLFSYFNSAPGVLKARQRNKRLITRLSPIPGPVCPDYLR